MRVELRELLPALEHHVTIQRFRVGHNNLLWLNPCAGTGSEKKKTNTPKPGRVKAIADRLLDCPWLEITYPRLTGYRYELLS